MTAARKAAATPVALGLRAIRGGGIIVGVALDNGEPRVALSSFLATAAENDRLSLEPYHVAAGMCPDGKVSTDAAAAVAEGRKRQDALAAKGLEDIADRLRAEKGEPVAAALLVNRAGWVTDLLAYSIAFADHPPVAEGLAVRDALRFACRQAGVAIDEIDEKSLPNLASEVLRLSPAAIETRLKAFGAEAGKPWRKERKLACLAAWLTLAKAE
jgi:hypothetical protein